MTEQEQIKAMKKLAAKLFKRMRSVMDNELKAHELNIDEFHNITFTAMSFVTANLIMWVKFMTEQKTGYSFDSNATTTSFLKSIVESIKLCEEDQSKRREKLQ
jgi:hypothetical protein